MRVNLNYSVKLDEVLLSIEKLYIESKQKFEKDYKTMEVVFNGPFLNANLEQKLQNIAQLRQAVSEFDIKLDELFNILVGYKNILENQNEASPELTDEPPEKETDE